MLSDYRVMAMWFGAHFNQEVRFSSAVEYKKGPQVLTSLRSRNYHYYFQNQIQHICAMSQSINYLEFMFDVAES